MTKSLLAGAALLATPLAAHAECGIESGSIRILSNDFPALHVVVDAAEECAGGNVQFRRNQTRDHESLSVPALSTNPAEYTSHIVANSSILPLLNNDLIQPLDELIAQYGETIGDNQKIAFGGNVMAIAFMSNTQHLFYRQDVLEEAGVEAPSTYEEMLEAAETIRESGAMRYPIGGTFGAGWNLAQEFINMYLGHGGAFFAQGSAEPAINNEQGVAALEMLKALSEYMNPDYLTFDSNALQAEFEAGNVALANFWASRAGAVLDDQGSTPEVTENIAFGPAPTVGGGDIPATTLWWDGFTIARNISDEDAEATFRAYAHAMTAQTANDNADTAVWLIPGYEPTALSENVLATVGAGARPYPMQPYMGLMHNALGAELAPFLQGNIDASTALANAEAAYTAAAREAGFLN